MAQARRAPIRIRPQVEELEPRVLYSADLPLGLGPVAGQAERRLLDAATHSPSAEATQAAGLQLVVIDAAVDNAESLLADLRLDGARVEVLRLHPDGDGVAEIGAALGARQDVAAVHILAHGEAGALRLGSTYLDSLAMFARADEIAAWGGGLHAEADILVYGCDVGLGKAGDLWVNTLAQLTGADVAASDDATGSAALGGDWLLERRSGAVDETAILAPRAEGLWSGLLYSNGYTYRRDIDVPMVAGTHADFPLLVAGTYSYLATTANSGNVQNANGYDIVFTADAAGSQQLDHEIESYDPSTGAIVFWVRVPTLASGTTIYMFYGNAAVSNSQEDVSGTWDSAYRGVWHLNEPGSGAPNEFQDSTANANHGQGGGATPNSVPAATVGQIGTAQDFTVTESDYIGIADSASLAITGSLTMEAWIQGSSWESGWNTIVGRQFGSADVDAYWLGTAYSTTSTTTAAAYVNGTNTNGSPAGINANTWYHLVATFNSSGSAYYVNGSQVGTGLAPIFVTDANPVLIGAEENAATNIPGYFFNGKIDEVRLSSTTRSANWIATQYANQNAPATFYSVGAASTSNAPTATNLNAPETYTEDVDLNLVDIVVADTDSPNLSVTLTLSNPAAGSLTTATSGSTTSTFSAGVWSASGPIAEVNTLLAGLTYDPALNFNASFNITTQVSDGVNTIGGSKAMTGTSENDPPVITSNGGGPIAFTSIDEGSTTVTTVQASDPDVPAQPITYSISGGNDAALFQIDAASGALSFRSGPDFEAPGDVGGNNVYEVVLRASESVSSFADQALSVQVTNVNDAPVISLPASRSVLQGQALVFSSATGTAISVADVDIGSGSLSITLTALHGTLTLSQTAGLSFSTGDGSGDATLSFNGTLVAVNAALNGLSYTPVSGYNGTDSLSVVANDNGNSGGAPLTDSDSVAINVLSPNAAALWLTSDKDVTVSTGVVFDTGEVMSFGDPNFALEPDVTSGTFASAIDFRDFTSNNSADLSGIHRVSRTVTVGSGSSIFTLQRGDVLFSVENSNTFGGVSVSDRDLAVFRPASPNNYASGTFSILLSEPSGSDKLREFVLIEQSITVGGVNLNPGDFLTVHSGGANDKDVRRYVATGVGASTAGTFSVFIDGADIGFDQQIGGLHLIQEPTVLGDTTLATGQLLLSVRDTDTVGTNNLNVTGYDIFTLTVSQAGSNTVATAALLFQGSEVGVSSSGENPYGIAVDIPNYAPVLSGANNFSTFDEDTGTVAGTQVADLIVGHVDDPDIGDARGIAVTGLTGDGTWQYSTNGGGTWNNFGTVSTSSARLLGSANQARFLPTVNWNGTATMSFQAWDQTAGSIGGTLATMPNGGYTAFSATSATSNQVVTPVNDAPAITSDGGDATASRSVAENTTAVTDVDAGDIDLPTQTLTYSLSGGADMARFQINPSSGVLSFISAPDYENPGDVGGDNVYNVVVRVSDGSLSDTQALAVMVSSVNDNTPAITSNGGGTTASFSVSENSTAVTTVTATDADLPAQSLTYSVSGTDMARFTINPTTGALSFISAPDYETPADSGGENVYDIVVQVSDGVNTDTQALAITVLPLNDNSPIITSNGGGATASASVNENTTFVTTVTAGDADRPTQTLTYTITGGADAARFQIVKVDDGHATLSFVAAPNHEVPVDANLDNVYEVTVQVSDGNGGADTQAIFVSVANAHEPFVVNNDSVTTNEDSAASFNVIGNDFRPDDTLTVFDYTLPVHGSLTLGADGAGNYTPALDYNGADSFQYIVRGDNTPDGRTHYWRLDGNALDSLGSANGTVNGASTVTGRYGYALDFDGVNDYALVPDLNYNNEFTVSFWFKLADNNGNSYRYMYSHGTDVAAQDSLNVYTVEASTGVANPDTLRTRFRDSNDSDTYSSLDISMSGLANNQWHQYALTVSAANGATVYVDGVQRGNISSLGGDSFNPTTALYLGARADLDSSRFDDGALDSVQVFSRALSGGEVGNLYSNAGVSATVTLTVVPVNDAPVITSNGGGATATLTVAENTASTIATVAATDVDNVQAALSYSLAGGDDAARFQINPSTGALSFLSAPDYDSPSDVGGNNVYDVTIRVSDGAGGSDTQALAVTVTPINDNPPVITSNGGGANTSVDVAENSTAVTTVVAIDSDRPIQTLTYSITGGTDAGRFQIDANTGVLRYRVAPNYEAPNDANSDNVYQVIVGASDGNGLNDSQTIDVHVTPVNDNSPVMTLNGGALTTINVNENTTAVTTLTATDADLPAQTLSYSIVGGLDAASFQIGPTSGVLSFRAPPDYDVAGDANGNNIWSVDIQVSDGTNTDTQTIWAQIQPVNDNDPIITSNGSGTTAAVNVAENVTAVTTVTATDADRPAQTLSYSIVGGDDSARFNLGTSTGVLTFRVAPDYEVPSDANADNVYVVTVQASDGSRTDTQTISVTVTPMNDRTPEIVSNGGGATAAVNIAENTTAVTTVSATDADSPAQPLTYSLDGGADAARFQIDGVTGALSFLVAPDRETPSDANADNIYMVNVRVSDGARSDTQAISVTVTGVNEHSPDITSNGGAATASINLDENSSAVTTVVATDADRPAETLVYSLAGGADVSLFTLDSTSGALDFIVAPDFEAPQNSNTDNVYDVIVRVSDGTHSVTQALSISINNTNDNGVGAIADSDSPTPNQIAENTVGYVGLTAHATDSDGDTVTYSLTDNAGGRFGIDPGTGRVSVANATLLNYESTTSHAIKVRATSTDASYSERNFTIQILPVNDNSPVITSDGGNAPATLYVAENTTAVTTVTATDADLPAQALAYNIAGGSDANRFQINETSGVLSFIAAPDFESPTDSNIDNVYQVIVEASDGSHTGSQTLSITVTPRNDITPAITSNGGGATAAVSIQEDDNATVYVTTVTATDADLPAQTLLYEIAGGVDSGFFQIDPNTGILSFIHPNYDALADFDRNNVYEVIIGASDGDRSDLQTINVTVTPRNDNNPEITSNGGGETASISFPENEVAVTTVTAKDSDLPPQTLIYSIVGGTDAARFQIVAATGVLSFLSGPDYDIPGDANLDNIYEVVVQVRDSDGGTDTQALSVAVTGLNDSAPVITSNGGGRTATIGVPEDQAAVTTVIATDDDVPAQTLSYAIVGGADAALFEINAQTGVLRFLSGHDYEAPVDANLDNAYEVIVEVDDGNGGLDTQEITVAVAPVNDNAPVITSDGGGATATVDVAENTVAVTDVDATDADRPPQELVYSIVGGSDAAQFRINSGNGVLEFLNAPNYEAPTDVGGDNAYIVIVQVDDLAGGADIQEIKIRVTPVNEFSPVITSDGGGDSASLSFSENTSISTPITQVTASDTDRPLVPLTYSLIGGADRALFQIDAANGNLFFVTAPVYQPGGDNLYVVTVQVLGEGGDTDTQTITVEVTEFNLAPVLNGGDTQSVTVDENSSDVTQLSATDAEDDANQRPLTYSIQGGADANRFSIDAQSGRLSFVQAPDYEVPSDQGADNVYEVTVSVRDSRGATDRQSLRVAVAPLNESPESLGIPDQRAQEGEPFSLTVADAFSDPDAGDRLTYSVAGLPAWLGFDANTGMLSGTPGIEDATEAPLSIVVTATDADGLSIATRFALSVGNANVAPTANADDFSGDEDTSLRGNVLDNDRDLDRDPLSATLLSGPSHGRLDFNADGSFVYTPNADFNGNDGFTYQISDGELNSAPASVTLTLLPVNDAPTITVNDLAIAGGGRVTLSPANLSAADVDSAGNLTFMVIAVEGGQFESASQPGVAISAFSEADVAAGRVIFVSTNSAKQPAFTLRAGDGQVVSLPSQGGVDFTPVILVENTAPPPSSGTVAPAPEKPADKTDQRKDDIDESAGYSTGDALVDAALRLVQQVNDNAEAGAARLIAVPQTLASAVSAAFSQPIVALAGFQAMSVAAAPFQLAETQMALMESMQIEAFDALKNSFGSDSYTKALDQMRQALGREATLQQVVIGSSVALSGGLSIGYVLWLLRGGALLGSLLSAMPAWTLLDPVPVLAYYMKQDKGAAQDKTERMFEKASAAKQKTIWGRIRGFKR